MSSYLGVLRLPGAGRLTAGLIGAELSFGMVALTILLAVERATGSDADAGLAVAAFMLGSGVLAPLRGRLVDRNGGRVLLPAFTLGYGGCIAALGVLAGLKVPAWPLSALAMGAGASAPPLVASTRGAWASHAAGLMLRRAYAVMSVSSDVTTIVAPGIAAILFVWAPLGAVTLCAGCALLGATLIGPLTRPARVQATTVSRHAGSGSGMRLVVLVGAAMGVALGLVDVTVPASALAWHLPGLAGILLGAFAAGSVAGGLGFARHRWRVPAGKRYLVSAFALGVLFLPLMVASSPAVLGSLLVLSGLAYGPVTVSLFETLDLATSVGATEALAWVTTAEALGGSLGSGAAGIVVTHIGLWAPFGLACCALAGPTGVALMRRPWEARNPAPRTS